MILAIEDRSWPECFESHLRHANRAKRRISAQGLVKSFGDVRALDGIDLEAAPGTVLGVLGPNGAGKTTAVRVLTTLLEPDAGHARASPGSTWSRMPRRCARGSGSRASTRRWTRT